jgi:hypothetical protein
MNPTDVFSRVFGHRGFRGQQQAIVDHVLAGRHALLIMPTGGGIDIRTHADRELLSASKLILDTKNPAYRAVAAVRSEASSSWRTVTLPYPVAGIRLLPQNSLGMFANTMQTYRDRLQEAARVSHGPAPRRLSSGASPGP